MDAGDGRPSLASGCIAAVRPENWSFPPSLLLDRPGGQAGLPILLKHQESDDQRDDSQQGSGQDKILYGLGSRRIGLFVPLVEADGQRIPLGILEHDQRQEVVVPSGHDGEEGRGHDAGGQKRQGDGEEGPHLAGPVHPGGFQQLGGHGLLGEDPHQIEAEGADQAGDDHGPGGVGDADLGEKQELRDRQGDARNGDGSDDDGEDRFAPGEAELGQGVAAHDGQQGGPAGADHHVEQSVEQPAREDSALVGEGGDDVVPDGEGMAEAQTEGGDEIRLGLGGIDDQPDQGEDAIDGEDAGQDGQADAAPGIGRIGESDLRRPLALGCLVPGDPLLAGLFGLPGRFLLFVETHGGLPCPGSLLTC